MVGKQIRMERIIDRNSNNTVIVPMDHGVTIGPVKGLGDMRETVLQIERHWSKNRMLDLPGLDAKRGHVRRRKSLIDRIRCQWHRPVLRAAGQQHQYHHRQYVSPVEHAPLP